MEPNLSDVTEVDEGFDPTGIESLFELQQDYANVLRQTTSSERIGKLKKLEAAFLAAEEDIFAALAGDFGKPVEEILLTEIAPSLVEIRHAQRNLRKWMKPRRVDTPPILSGTTSEIQYEAKGVSLIIAPWNYTFTLTIGPLVGAVSAGCPVIIKPSEHTPRAAHLLKRILNSVFPDTEVAVVIGDASAAKSLLEFPFRHIYFTGSPAVGRSVMTKAAQHLASVTLELGGKSPAIVDESADLVTSAAKIAFGKFANCGQTCVAPDYLLVHENIFEPFLEELLAAIRAQFGDDTLSRRQTPDLTRVVNRSHTERLVRMLEEAVDRGARVVLGGSYDLEDRFVEPTVLTDVPEDTLLMRQEIFGPILPVLRFESRADVIDRIQSDPPPLSAYIFSSDTDATEELIRELPSGGICVNETLLHFVNPELPFGGLALSGIGRGHGKAGFLAFSNEKGVLRQHLGNHLLGRLYPPFNERTRRWAKRLIKLS